MVLKSRIPVILDTDIGSDIDDTWALVMMLNSPEIDIKLIVTTRGNTVYRAKIVAKILEIAGRTDIPIAIGMKQSDKIEAQGGWVSDYNLDLFKGTVYFNGIHKLAETILSSEKMVTVLSIGPLTNISEAYKYNPEIAKNSKIVAMLGSIKKGYYGSDKICAECNVKLDPNACRNVFSAPWEILITPVDTCGAVKLSGNMYQEILSCGEPLAKALIDNYRIWESNYPNKENTTNSQLESTILYDTVAVYLAIAEDFLEIEEVPLRIDDEGYTLISDEGRSVRCALGWVNKDGFTELLLRRIVNKNVKYIVAR